MAEDASGLTNSGSGTAAIIFPGDITSTNPLQIRLLLKRRNIAPRTVPKAPLGAIRNIPTITPKIPAIINPILTMCNQITLVGVRGDVDVQSESHISTEHFFFFLIFFLNLFFRNDFIYFLDNRHQSNDSSHPGNLLEEPLSIQKTPA